MNRLISHQEALRILKRLSTEGTEGDTPYIVQRRTDFKMLEQYIFQCNQTSLDLKNTIKTVLEMHGPVGLEEIRKSVESKRNKLPMLQ